MCVYQNISHNISNILVIKNIYNESDCSVNYYPCTYRINTNLHRHTNNSITNIITIKYISFSVLEPQ